MKGILDIYKEDDFNIEAIFTDYYKSRDLDRMRITADFYDESVINMIKKNFSSMELLDICNEKEVIEAIKNKFTKEEIYGEE